MMTHSNPQRSRPAMPDYGLHTGEEGMFTWPEIAARLHQSRNYWVCSTRPDGKPHAAPVWAIWLEDALYFACGRSSRKGRNLLLRPAVVVHLESGDDTVIVEGEAREITDRATYERVRAVYGAKYPLPDGAEALPADPDPQHVLLVVRPQRVLAWLEHDFPRTATRFTFADQGGTEPEAPL
ncbi:MAG: pyridoxamine 5'-phosphate oxidase family protein [Anaerolineae bacterium]|jgi:nitroimidazol reductase NimA-like FMN-containing flavoprotein (pyridoxamine 5'-phosphate oxidase superfamily)|nr:pyridoxamine 5'-phosphate oxidase family protein [Anaerolineae bacterium]